MTAEQAQTVADARELRHLEASGADEATQSAIRNRIVERTMWIAKRFAGRLGTQYRMDPADLIQEGVLGLYDALARFDPDVGVTFDTYAFWWVRQRAQRAARRSVNPVQRATSRNWAQHRRRPIRAEDVVDWPEPEVAIAGDQVAALLEHLPPDERHALRARFLEGKPVRVVATELGVSRERGRQIIEKALHAMRRALIPRPWKRRQN
jgi:RNA polymerase sigma factor (sigma-70 family)